jgi:hypothetical protein
MPNILVRNASPWAESRRGCLLAHYSVIDPALKFILAGSGASYTHLVQYGS